MLLELDLSARSAAYGEPITARLRFSDAAADRTCPMDPSSGPFTILRLMRETGEVVAEADGIMRDQRLGLPVVPGDERSMPTAELRVGTVFEWQSELLSYFAIPEPGRYLVDARFVFPPSNVDVTSDPVALEIVAANVHRLDVLVDQSAVPVLHMIQEHGPELAARRVATFRSVRAPGTPWSGVTIHDAHNTAGPTGEARVSMTSFATRETFVHDFHRWVAWIDGRDLVLGRYHDAELDLLERLALVSSGEATLIGRPFQHADLGVTVLVEERAEDGPPRLVRLDFDADGGLRARRHVSLPGGARAADAECDGEGGVHVLARVETSASLWHVVLPVVGAPIRTRLLLDVPPDAQSNTIAGIAAALSCDLLDDVSRYAGSALHRWVRLRIQAKPFRHGSEPTVMAAGAFEEEGALVLLTASAALGGARVGDSPRWHAELWDLSTLFAREEGDGRDELAAVDLCANERSVLEIVAVSGRGRVWRRADGAVTRLPHVAPTAAAQVKAVRLGDQTAVFFPQPPLGFRFQTFGVIRVD